MKVLTQYYDVVEVFAPEQVFDYMYSHFDGYKFDDESSYMLNELHRIYKEKE